MSVDEENCRSMGVVIVRIRKIHHFLINEFRKNFGCLVSDPIFNLGG